MVEFQSIKIWDDQYKFDDTVQGYINDGWAIVGFGNAYDSQDGTLCYICYMTKPVSEDNEGKLK